MSERWMPVPGYEGRYEVSDLGQVRSWVRPPRGFRDEPMVLRPRSAKVYPAFWISRGDGSPRTHMYVHRAVLLAFAGPPAEGQQVAHLDGNPLNARLENLAWVTCKENHSHKVAHGTQPRGEFSSAAKLTLRQVEEIRLSKSSGVALARIYGVSPSAICIIRKGKTWKASSSKTSKV